MSLMATITHWWSHWQAGQELSFLDADELGALARDAGLSSDQLILLAARGARGEELPRFLRAVGLVPERMERTHPGNMRDMSIICSGCQSVRRCRRDLDRGWSPVVQRYCPSAGTIKALKAERCRAAP